MGKLLFYSILSHGHVNVCISIGRYLLEKYGDEHEIHFAVDEIWLEKMKKIEPRFIYDVYRNPRIKEEKRDPMVDFIEQLSPFLFKSPIEKAKTICQFLIKEIDCIKELDECLFELIEKLKPDYILADQLLIPPCFKKLKVKWGYVCSANPLFLDIKSLPPMSSGLGIDEKDKILEFRKTLQNELKTFRNLYNKILEENQVELLPEDSILIHPDHINVYCYPKELDYFTEQVKPIGNWFRIDSPIINDSPVFKLPESFKSENTKVIFFSMGSLFCGYLELMNRFVGYLGKLPYKFIVSKGFNGDKIELPENCIGENFVDQKAILPVVDMIISHGGNNTLTECFHYGVPMLILPIMADQLDNAKRIKETNYGESLDIKDCSFEQFKHAIEIVINSEEIKLKMKNASKRIQKDNGLDKFVNELVSYLKH